MAETNTGKSDLYLTTLTRIQAELSDPVRSYLTEERLQQLSSSLLDGTVFEIMKELEEIQSLTEEQLLQERMKVATSHKKKQTELNQKLKEQLRTIEDREQDEIVRQKYELDKLQLEKTSQGELVSKDKEIVRQLDQIVSEQQSILEQICGSLFFITEDPDSLRIQMGLIEVIQRVGAELGISNSAM